MHSGVSERRTVPPSIVRVSSALWKRNGGEETKSEFEKRATQRTVSIGERD